MASEAIKGDHTILVDACLLGYCPLLNFTGDGGGREKWLVSLRLTTPQAKMSSDLKRDFPTQRAALAVTSGER